MPFFLIIILALIGAGVYTGNIGFYWAAGFVGGFAVLITLSVVAFANKVRKDVNDTFNKFDKFGRF